MRSQPSVDDDTSYAGPASDADIDAYVRPIDGSDNVPEYPSSGTCSVQCGSEGGLSMPSLYSPQASDDDSDDDDAAPVPTGVPVYPTPSSSP